MERSPLFVTFEGGDGSGKTTLVRKLAEELQKRGYSVVTTREPGGASLSEHIRKLLLQADGDAKIGARAELMLFLAARAQHVDELIKPALEQGKIVLCDRFNDSTVAYQGYARGLGMEAVQRLCNFACNGAEPDLTFFLDVDPAEGLKRVLKTSKDTAKPGRLDRIEAEGVEFYNQVRTGMRRLAHQFPERIRTIDAHQSPQTVRNQAIAFLEPFLSEDV